MRSKTFHLIVAAGAGDDVGTAADADVTARLLLLSRYLRLL